MHLIPRHRIKNWAKFQHFKDRRPPWVKLYRDLLEDIEWHQLDPKAAKDLVSFWLIASERDGELPDIRTLAFRLRCTEKQVESSLSALSHWLEQDDAEVISPRYQGDRAETETETETETDTRSKPRAPKFDASEAFRKAKRAPVSASVIETFHAEAAKARWTLTEALRESIARGWTGFKAEWVESRMTRREDIARATVPGPQGEDPALRKIREDEARAAPMPAAIRDLISPLLKRKPDNAPT
jgi:hypothetical protein